MTDEMVFGHLAIRPVQRQLLVRGAPVSLGTRAFDVLLALIERRDRVVSKAELLDLVWPGVIVEENNLAVQISALRKTIGSDAIATLTGRGYRFTLAGDGPAESNHIVRRLITLAYGQIHDWHRHLAEAPKAAIDTWRAIRARWIESLAPSMGGRIIDLAAEGVWIEFASVVDASRWALDVQSHLAREQPAGSSPLRFRVSICVEDAVIDEGRPVGEAMQYVADLLAAAPTDAEFIVADCVRSVLRHLLPLQFSALSQPPNCWRAERIDDGGQTAGRLPAPAGRRLDLTQSRLPAIAVLPFESEVDAGYFGDGITEEIINLLAANRAMMVIARNSTLRYRNTTQRPAEIAAALGVRYLLSGSLQRSERGLRLFASLIDAQSDHVIWSNRFEGGDDDLFGFQAEIAANIAGAIDPRVTEAETRRAAHLPTESMTAYDCVLHGLSLQVSFRDADFAAAGDYFRRAVELDPRYAQANAHLAWWHNLKFGEGRSLAMPEDARTAERLSKRAVLLDPRDALVLSIAAYVQAFVMGRPEPAMDMFEQALTINPSCAFGWARSATAASFLGRGEDAQRRVRNAIRLSPFDAQSFTFFTTHGTASMVMGRFDEAVAWYSKARRTNPGYKASWRMLIAALALAGDVAEAREQAAEFLIYDPQFRISDFITWYPMSEPHLTTVLRGMRLGGLPE